MHLHGKSPASGRGLSRDTVPLNRGRRVNITRLVVRAGDFPDVAAYGAWRVLVVGGATKLARLRRFLWMRATGARGAARKGEGPLRGSRKNRRLAAFF
jgi:hypothetical protein